MWEVTLKPLPAHTWDIRESERVDLTLKIKALLRKENVYSSDSNSNAGSSRRSSNDHKKNMIYHHNKRVVVVESFDDSMSSYSGNFVKKNIDVDLPFAKNNNNLIVVTKSSRILHHKMMCEWSYRIVDYINGNRELVAISQNYVNRFLGIYDCNVKGYKLVVITCLYLAIKLHNQRPLSMKSLTELNGNDKITIQDITEMESMILKTLNWTLCPPTASAFCNYFFLLWPTEVIKLSTMQSILQRSCFFSELSVFDNSLVSLLNQSEIAFAATLNAIEELSPTLLSSKSKLSFIDKIAFSSGMDPTSDRINSARDKIWALYQKSTS